VGVAVSGGADSVALLLLLLELREKLGIVLSVVHFNHKLRGKSSDADEKFVSKLAASYGLTFHLGHADVAAKAKHERANLEDTARRARYAFFSELASKGLVMRVAVAHTADDQAETVLAHILRGTGLTGLGGIHPVVEHVIRPLLGVRRAQLRSYLRSKKQKWREDATNRDTLRMRARIRKKLLPLLEKQFQPAVVQHLATLAELAREDEALLEAVVKERATASLKNGRNAARISVCDLLGTAGGTEMKTNAALAQRLVRHIVKEIKPRAGQLNAAHTRAIVDLAERGENGKCLPLPGGLEVRRERDALVFCASEIGGNTKPAQHQLRKFEVSVELAGSGETCVPIGDLGCVFRFTAIDWPVKRGETIETGSVFDRDTLRFPLVLRNWRPGDKLQPFGHRNTRKLKRLLNEKRISRWDRVGWPVLTSGGVLAWTRGCPVAREFAASERTRAAMVISEEPL
jgi:tRNA(Ile)-lysidine synthase